MYSSGLHRSQSPGSGRSGVLRPKCRRIRMWTIFMFAMVWSGLIVWRLFSLQISNYETWQDWALKQHFAEVRLSSERGPIYDREGRLMAVSVPAGSVYVRPAQVQDKKQTAAELSKIVGLKPERIMALFESKQPFVWVKRQIPRAHAEKAAALKISGVGYVLESRRFYPYNQAASSLIGKVGTDGIGLSGIEAVYEEKLHGENYKGRVTRDAYGNIIDVGLSQNPEFELPRGNAISLTIDADLQVITDEELEAGRVAANALHGMAVMMDADTGEILAMSQAPAANFNNSKLNPKRDLKNMIVETVFEPGSIFKPIVAAAALDMGIATPAEVVNCENGRFPVGRHTIKDVHPSGLISFRDVVVRSSNIGMTKIGMRMGSERLYDYLRKFGFGEAPLGILPGETKGILRHVDSWAKVDVATHSFGQGIAVTPLQVLRATAAVANGGKLPSLRIINDSSDFELRRVISESAADKAREMMFGVVTDARGTGKNADVAGVRIGGKTGTAQKARKDGRGYAPGSYMASFVGFADANAIGINKNLALIVIIDEPRAKSIYGGTLAAPVFKRVMQRSLHLLTTRNGLNSGGSKSKDLIENKAPEGLRVVAYNVQ